MNKGITAVVMCILFVVLLGVQQWVSAASITTGGKTGTYIKVGHNISRTIGGDVQTSKGGEENINRLLAGTHQVGLAQMDTYAYMASKKPELYNTVELMGPLYKEAVYIAVNANGRIKSEDDLQRDGAIIAIGKKGSGGASTWNYMRDLEPGYKKSAIVFKGGIRSLGKLAASTITTWDNTVPPGHLDAVLFVTKPVVGGKMMATVMKNKNLRFIAVNDKDLNDKLELTGQPVYDFCTVDLSKGIFNDTELKTICMDAVVLANTETDEDYLEELSDLLLNYKATLLQ